MDKPVADIATTRSVIRGRHGGTAHAGGAHSHSLAARRFLDMPWQWRRLWLWAPVLGLRGQGEEIELPTPGAPGPTPSVLGRRESRLDRELSAGRVTRTRTRLYMRREGAVDKLALAMVCMTWLIGGRLPRARAQVAMQTMAPPMPAGNATPVSMAQRRLRVANTRAQNAVRELAELNQWWGAAAQAEILAVDTSEGAWVSSEETRSRLMESERCLLDRSRSRSHSGQAAANATSVGWMDRLVACTTADDAQAAATLRKRITGPGGLNGDRGAFCTMGW